MLLVTGSVTLEVTWDSVRFGDHPTCFGEGDYADVNEGAQVVVTDAAGATVGVGELDFGVHREEGCVFGFSLAVPAGQEFYGLEVAHRGRAQYSAAQMSAPIELSIGQAG